MNNKQDIIKSYLDKFPNVKTLTLAKKIYNENSLLWNNVETVRSAIRNLKGTSGKKLLQKLNVDKYLSEEKIIEKYNLPESIDEREEEYKPFIIHGNKGLLIMDLHIPFHDISAIESMLNYTVNRDIDFIVLNGDIGDFFGLSVFIKDPRLIDFQKDREAVKQFIMELKRLFPKAKIYYKFGNHEKRLETYLMVKAPEIFGCREFELKVLLDLYNLEVEYIPDDFFITLGKLQVIHGHEYRKAVSSPANPARTLFLRTKATSLCGHYHQSSEHTESKINGDMITCWSVGCLCKLHPKFMPLNKWNHGFAIYHRENDNFWTVENKRIINGRVV